jgi:hypothetical protein
MSEQNSLIVVTINRFGMDDRQTMPYIDGTVGDGKSKLSLRIFRDYTPKDEGSVRSNLFDSHSEDEDVLELKEHTPQSVVSLCFEKINTFMDTTILLKENRGLESL